MHPRDALTLHSSAVAQLRYTNHTGPLPEFKIEPEFALELLMAANYLDT